MRAVAALAPMTRFRENLGAHGSTSARLFELLIAVRRQLGAQLDTPNAVWDGTYIGHPRRNMVVYDASGLSHKTSELLSDPSLWCDPTSAEQTYEPAT